MESVVAYSHRSTVGTFVIRLHMRRWEIWCDGEMLGSYPSAESALDDLVGGHSDWPGITDPSTLGLPDELADWEAHAARAK